MTIDPDIWVDASSSWGISIILGKIWYAWSLTPGWRAKGRDISWAESITLEMAMLILTNEEYHDCSVIVQGNNTGIIGAYDKGRSCNVPHNDSIHQITSSIIPNNITIIPIYVMSAMNRANPISHGILGPSNLCAPSPPALPPELAHFLRNV